jgi:hypothetical protein
MRYLRLILNRSGLGENQQGQRYAPLGHLATTAIGYGFAGSCLENRVLYFSVDTPASQTVRATLCGNMASSS